MAELTDHDRQFTFGTGHIPAASIAAIISVAVHIGLLIFAAQIDLELISGGGAKPLERKYEPVHLGTVETTPEIEERVLSALREIGSDVGGKAAEAVDEMSIAPEEAVTEPPALEDNALMEEMEHVAEPTPPPEQVAWVPRQEILAIENIAVGDSNPGLERRMIPAIERVANAPDIVLPASRDSVAAGGSGRLPVAPPTVSEIVGAVVGGMDDPKPLPEAINEAMAPGGAQELFEESVEDVTDVEAIERVLTARVQTYSSSRDFRYSYFRLEVERAGEELLPVRPKDIILVQDCSASMSEQRLYFCREGLRRSLAHIRPSDRFNIARFADHTETCFDGWVTKTPETIAKAMAYIDGMKAQGYTDLFASMQDLLSLECESTRPVIAFVITDGLANKGLTDNSEIIGEFSRRNAGKISVFTMGASQLANRYLIDLLSYCNKGYVNVISKGRWDIPDSAEAVMRGISRPVLGDLRLQFATDSSCEVYPRQVSNLYLDRPLVLYGRCRKGEEKLVFQAMGQAGDVPCDLIFDLPLNTLDSRSSDKTIRQQWAQQKIYHLIGEYARTRDAEVLAELRGMSKSYKEPIPYKRSLF
ncbi:MAG: VWA domain-containing protein [Verrucomicrobia bacterium]|jgi:Mg-chelatase subunit ChlD|nr:VWA domain-containing protein [Verrucomicrobiota bacterium]